MRTLLIWLLLATAAWGQSISPVFDAERKNNPYLQELDRKYEEAGRKYGVANGQLPKATGPGVNNYEVRANYLLNHVIPGKFGGYHGYSRGCYGGYHGRGHSRGRGHK